MPTMFRDAFEAFAADCARRIYAGRALTPLEAAAFSRYLEARERAGHRLLGAMAGPDEPTDTVTGRCGHAPAATLRSG